MGTTSASISLDQYLNSAYEPDRDFVDGVLLERHVGTQRHALLQTFLAVFFSQYRKSHRINVFTECRLLVDAAARRYRIPDVMALEVPYTKGKVVVDVPAVIVEIKSPDDTFDDIVDRCFDYEKLTVPNILVMDPDNQRAWLFQQGNMQLLTGAAIRLKQLAIDFPFAQLFVEIDDDNR
ncbi:MAG: Uma2 family endonuclease [Bryobacteraceae bacterium]|jgi:Uma2 family endonuclease